jgi:hypothetical protein
MGYNLLKIYLKSLSTKLQLDILNLTSKILYHSVFDDMDDIHQPKIPLEFRPVRIINDRLAHDLNKQNQGQRG